MTYQMSRLTLAVRQKMNPSASGPGPQKYSTLHLGMKPSLHRLAEGEKACVVLPQETAPNKVILRKVVGFNTQLDFKLNKQYTIFVRDSVQTTEGSAIAHLISDCSDSEIQCWMRFMTAKYPVAAAASLPSPTQVWRDSIKVASHDHDGRCRARPVAAGPASGGDPKLHCRPR